MLSDLCLQGRPAEAGGREDLQPGAAEEGGQGVLLPLRGHPAGGADNLALTLIHKLPKTVCH